MAPRTALVTAAGSPAVLMANVMCWASRPAYTGSSSAPTGLLAFPSRSCSFMSPMTPTTVRNTVLSVTAVSWLMSVGKYIRRPIGSWPGQNRFASFSSTMIEHGAGARRARVATLVEEAAAHELRAHRLEVARRDVHVLRRNHRLARLHLVALGQDDAVVLVAAERNRRRRARGDDARQRANAPQRLVGELYQRVVLRVARARQRDRRRQHAIGDKARLNRQHFAEAGEQQAGADEQHERERDLRDDERAAERARAAAGACRSGLPRAAPTSG